MPVTTVLSGRRIAASLLLALLPLAGGCTQWYYEFGEALPEDYERRAEGQSLAAVLATLGPPLRYAATDQGLLMAWESWQIRETSIGLSLGFIGVDALEADWGDARISGDYLVMVFNERREVSAVARASSDNDVGNGAAVQPFAGWVSVVEVEDLLYPLPQHSWGASQLLPIPAALNNSSRPGMGDTGIEQRGTPVGAGQRVQGWPDR